MASGSTTMRIEGVDDNGKTELIALGKVRLCSLMKNKLSLSAKFDPSSVTSRIWLRFIAAKEDWDQCIFSRVVVVADSLFEITILTQ